jgi:hypothetical protein
MIIALFVIMAVVVSMPMVAIVVVSMASHREDAAYSLGGPPQGMVQAVARRVLDFHTEDPAWPLPKDCGQATPAAPARRSVAPGPFVPGSVVRPYRSTVTDTPRPATSKVSVRTAA